MGMEQWTKAEMALQRIVNRQPHHHVALYQLSQVYLEQNKTGQALQAIRKAFSYGCSSGMHIEPDQDQDLPPCIWGPKCATRAHLCGQIIIQEADILRAQRQYAMAAQVSSSS